MERLSSAAVGRKRRLPRQVDCSASAGARRPLCCSARAARACSPRTSARLSASRRSRCGSPGLCLPALLQRRCTAREQKRGQAAGARGRVSTLRGLGSPWAGCAVRVGGGSGCPQDPGSNPSLYCLATVACASESHAWYSSSRDIVRGRAGKWACGQASDAGGQRGEGSVLHL